MTAPVLVQSDFASIAAGSTGSLTLEGVTAGNTILVALFDYGANTRTYSQASDDKGNTYNTVVSNGMGGARGSRIEYAHGVAAGDTVITITTSGGTDNYIFVACEIAANGNSLDVFDNFSSVAVTTHPCADVAEIDTAANVFVLMVGVITGSSVTITKPAAYTDLLTTTFGTISYLRSDTALANERGSWTTSANRSGLSCIASFKSAAVAPEEGEIIDGTKLGDSASGLRSRIGSVTDGFKSGDSFTGIRNRLGLVSDGSKHSDTVSGLSSRIALVSEGSKLSDAPTALRSRVGQITEGNLETDSFQGLHDLLVSFTEGIKLSDSMLAPDDIQPTHGQIFIDGITLSPSLNLNTSIKPSVHISDLEINPDE